jgi:dipeptidyl aminopeptidase/acylaminoacyl peptidase
MNAQQQRLHRLAWGDLSQSASGRPAQPAAQANTQADDQGSLIPREVLFGNPDRTSVRISPDGRLISFLAPANGVLNVWVGPIDDPDAAQPVTHDTGRGIRHYVWAYTNRHILYPQDENGDENWRIWRVDLETGEVSALTPAAQIHARIQGVSPERPTEVLVALNERVPALHDLYRIELTTGQRQLVLENEGFSAFVTDDHFQVHLGLRTTADGGQEILHRSEAGTWQPFLAVGPEDSLTTYPIILAKGSQVLYALDSRGRNTAALVAMQLATGEETVLVENPQADINDFIIHPAEHTVQAAAVAYLRQEWVAVDDTIAPDLAYLTTVNDGVLQVFDRTLDDRTWIVAYVQDNGPLAFYRYDRDAQAATYLFSDRVVLENIPLAAMHPVVIEARDELALVSYYSLPLTSDADGDGKPDQPLPLVLLVHGGPWGRDMWGFDPEHQFLTNRGYAVLSVNFRGSTGFGKAFTNAGDKQWGGKMHDDLVDAVAWAIKQGIADPAHIAIMGGSYGGYATLVGLTFTPELFACGVDLVGPANLITLLETIPPYWEPDIAMFATRVGDWRTEAGRAFLTQRSPLSYVDQIQAPLLIGQGANDPRVKRAESDQIVHAMQAKQIPVTYLVYPDEGHGFARPENRLSFYAVTEAFLATHLGGRYEPLGDAFANASIIVETGADEIPGLADALNPRR